MTLRAIHESRGTDLLAMSIVIHLPFLPTLLRSAANLDSTHSKT